MTNARTAKSTREKAAELRAEAAKVELRRRRMLITGSVMAVVAALVAVFVIVKVAQSNRAAETVAASAPPQHLTDGGVQVGQASAKVKIDLWEDFQCPACLNFEQGNAAQIQGWVSAGTAQVIYHPVAILDRMSSTNYSSRSANASAVVADTAPTAWPALHKALYDNQPAENSAGLPDAKLIDLAVAAGATKTAIEQNITSKRFASWVVKVTDDFSKKGYTSTPTIVINGKKLDSYDPALVKAAVEAAAKA